MLQTLILLTQYLGYLEFIRFLIIVFKETIQENGQSRSHDLRIDLVRIEIRNRRVQPNRLLILSIPF